MYLKIIAAGSLLVFTLTCAAAVMSQTSSDMSASVGAMTCSQLLGMSTDAQTKAGAGAYIAACQAASPSSTVQDAVSHNSNSTPTNNGQNSGSGNSGSGK